MKRSPLKRKKPMRRVSAKVIGELPPRKRTKYASRARATAYMLWVKTQPCVCLSVTPPNRHWQQVRCEGGIEADHLGERGLGRKALDNTCAPMCVLHHHDRSDHHGVFFSATREQMREWRISAIEATHLRAAAQGVEIPSC